MGVRCKSCRLSGVSDKSSILYYVSTVYIHSLISQNAKSCYEEVCHLGDYQSIAENSLYVKICNNPKGGRMWVFRDTYQYWKEVYATP